MYLSTGDENEGIKSGKRAKWSQHCWDEEQRRWDKDSENLGVFVCESLPHARHWTTL